MADVNIAIKDEASATAWLSKVTLLNEEYRDAMTEAGQTLDDMQNFADGTLVDEFVHLGSNILTAAKNTFDAINEIATTVNTVLKKASEFASKAVGIISKVTNLIGM